MTHTPASIAESLHISKRQVQRICRRLLGHRVRFSLDDTERARIVKHYLENKQNRPRKDVYADSQKISVAFQ